MKIYLYCDDQIYVFYLPEMKSGSYSFSPDNDEEAKLINVTVDDEKCKNTYNYNNTLFLGLGVINASMVYHCSYANNYSFEIKTVDNKLVLNVSKGKVYVYKLALNNNSYYIEVGDEVEFYGD